MAGRNTVRPRFSLMTSCSCSHSRARSISLRSLRSSPFRLTSVSVALDGLHQLPESRADEQVATPTCPAGLWVSKWSSSRLAPLRRRSAMPDQRGPFASEGHPDALRVVLAQREAARGRRRCARHRAMPLIVRVTCSGRDVACGLCP